MRKSIMIILLICIPMLVQAQLIKQMSISVLKESTAFPFTRFFPVHPGGEISFTLLEKQKEKSIANFNVAIGGFHHYHVANAFYIRGEYAIRPMIKSSLTIDFLANLGYMHTFYPGEVYELNADNGEFEKITQYGRPHVFTGIGMGMTYIKGNKVHPFIRQEFAIESPFANGIPVMIHSFLKLGLSIKLNKS